MLESRNPIFFLRRNLLLLHNPADEHWALVSIAPQLQISHRVSPSPFIFLLALLHKFLPDLDELLLRWQWHEIPCLGNLFVQALLVLDEVLGIFKEGCDIVARVCVYIGVRA